jgi:hypothetical protein
LKTAVKEEKGALKIRFRVLPLGIRERVKSADVSYLASPAPKTAFFKINHLGQEAQSTWSLAVNSVTPKASKPLT